MIIRSNVIQIAKGRCVRDLKQFVSRHVWTPFCRYPEARNTCTVKDIFVVACEQALLRWELLLKINQPADDVIQQIEIQLVFSYRTLSRGFGDKSRESMVLFPESQSLLSPYNRYSWSDGNDNLHSLCRGPFIDPHVYLQKSTVDTFVTIKYWFPLHQKV